MVFLLVANVTHDSVLVGCAHAQRGAAFLPGKAAWKILVAPLGGAALDQLYGFGQGIVAGIASNAWA